MKVLVSGAAGYIGSVLVGELLQQGHYVTAVDNLTYDNGGALLPYIGNPGFEFHREDVRNWLPAQNLAKKCDVIIPLAALVGAPLCEKRPEAAHDINHMAVHALVKSLSKYQRVISPNTNSGYGATDGTKACTEENPLNPISVYGVTKCAGERCVLEHENAVSLRLATVFGASPRMRMDLMVNDFSRRLLVDRQLKLYEGHFLRNFVGVRDVARAFCHFAFDCHATGVFNLGLPTANLTKLELAHRVCDMYQLSRRAVSEEVGNDPDKRNYLVSNDKVLATGFHFEQSLEDGIVEVAKVVGTHTPAQLAAMRNA